MFSFRFFPGIIFCKFRVVFYGRKRDHVEQRFHLFIRQVTNSCFSFNTRPRSVFERCNAGITREFSAIGKCRKSFAAR